MKVVDVEPQREPGRDDERGARVVDAEPQRRTAKVVDVEPQRRTAKVVDVEPQRRGAKVVDAVLAAALEELARVGYAGLSVEEVATRAGVNKTTVYRRWPRKVELVCAALADKVSRTMAAPDTGRVRDDLRVMSRSMCAVLGSSEGRGLALALMAADPAVIAIARELRADTSPQQVLRRAIARGELPENIDVEVVVDAIFGALHSRVLMKQSEISDAYLRTLIDTTLTGAASVARRAARARSQALGTPRPSARASRSGR